MISDNEEELPSGSSAGIPTIHPAKNIMNLNGREAFFWSVWLHPVSFVVNFFFAVKKAKSCVPCHGEVQYVTAMRIYTQEER